MKRLGKKTKELIKSEWKTIKKLIKKRPRPRRDFGEILIIKLNELNHLSN